MGYKKNVIPIEETLKDVDIYDDLAYQIVCSLSCGYNDYGFSKKTLEEVIRLCKICDIGLVYRIFYTDSKEQEIDYIEFNRGVFAELNAKSKKEEITNPIQVLYTEIPKNLKCYKTVKMVTIPDIIVKYEKEKARKLKEVKATLSSKRK